MYDCEMWIITLRKEHRLKVFENKILRGILDLRRDENGEWRNIHIEELTYFVPST